MTKLLLPSIACSICLFLAIPLKGQEAVGPVTPKPAPARPATAAPTLQSYEKTLDSLIKAGAAERAAKQLSPAELRTLLDRAFTIREHVAGIGVGPVTPKPLTPAPATPPATPPPTTPPGPKPGQPSPKDATETFKGLHQALQGTAKANPKYNLTAEDSRELQQVIDSLRKYSAS